jgi:hypothetical protein
MDIEVEKSRKPLLQKAAERLMELQQELDELTVQLALGKTEARDAFEEIKSDFYQRLVTLKHKAVSALMAESAETMQAKFEALEVQLALGKAESKEVFAEQLKKISHALQALEQAIQSKLPLGIDADAFTHEFTGLKLKLEILRLKVELKQFDLKDTFRDRMLSIRKSIYALQEKAQEEMDAGEKVIQSWKEEVQHVYKSIRNAIGDL